eukprot:834141_1
MWLYFSVLCKKKLSTAANRISMEPSFSFLITFIITIECCICGYNLIDADPMCMTKGNYCPYAKPWNINSIHPNPEERTTMLMRNIARLQPNAFIRSPYGKHKYGRYGPQTEYACNANAQSAPFYWLSELNQVCRFHDWAGSSCPSKQKGHNTCPEYCEYFPKEPRSTNACGYVRRSLAFIEGTGTVLGSEGLWGGNMGYTSEGHCGPVFNPDYTYIGVGHHPGTNGWTNLWAKEGTRSPPKHPLVQGAHFDERLRIKNDDIANDDKHLIFIVEYYGKANNNREAKKVYVLYDGGLKPLELVFGTKKSGFWGSRFLVPTQCKPYAFIVVDASGKTFRLPQDKEYFFGTRWDVLKGGKYFTVEYPCTENHYYKSGNSWIPNGRKGRSGSTAGCKGCSEAAVLAKYSGSGGSTRDDNEAAIANIDDTRDDTTDDSSGSCDRSRVPNNAKDCVKVRNVNFKGTNYNYGQWLPCGRFNNKAYYTNSKRNDAYLCFEERKSRWILTLILCSYDDRVADCPKNNVLDCGDNWYVKGVRDTDCSTYECDSNAFEIDDEMQCDDEYDDKLCMKASTLWNESMVEFEIYSNKCSENRHIYYYTEYDETYYIHYGGYDNWIISKGVMETDGIAVCYESDLLKCGQDSWIVKKTTTVEYEAIMGNFTIYDIDVNFEDIDDNKMAIYNQGCYNKQANTLSLAVSIVVIVVLFIISVFVGVFIWWRKKHKSQLRKERIDDESDEDIIEIEKEVFENTNTTI